MDEKRAKRDVVFEILRTKKRSDLWHGGLPLSYLRLDDAFARRHDLPDEVWKYFPVAAVALMEACSRMAVRVLIDLGGEFLENAAALERDLRIDFRVLGALHTRSITLGEFVAHLLPVSSREDINRHLSKVLGEDFIARVLQARGRPGTADASPESSPLIIEDPAAVLESVDESFRLRHVYCHEVARGEFDRQQIEKCYMAVRTFLSAIERVVQEIVDPEAPQTQAEATAQAGKRASEADSAMKGELEAGIRLLEEDEKMRTPRSIQIMTTFLSAQEAWQRYCELAAECEANTAWGGTMAPMLYFDARSELAKERAERLRMLNRILKSGWEDDGDDAATEGAANRPSE